METYLLQDLAVVMAAAGAMTLLCHYFKQPVVLGYLIAGLLIGPYTPPFAFIHNLDSIHTMAELGLIFLMFSLGLEFNLPKIRRVGFSPALAAVLEVTGMLVIGYLLGQSFGWNKMDSIFLGAILSMSSTTIIVKVLMDFKMLKEHFTQVVFGILVLEDIVAVVILSILSGLGSQGGPDTTAILDAFLRIGLFIVLFLVLGLFFIPKFIHWVSRFGSKEILGIVTLGFCLGGALMASFFNLSIALGAFLIGAVLAASKEIHEIEDWIHPVRDMFSAIFFVSAGMLIQPQLLWEYKIPILIVTLVTLVGKVISGFLGSFLVGYDIKTSARIGMSLAQIGEFSFVIASLGFTLNITSSFLYPLAVTVSSLTTLATPYLIRYSDHWVDMLLRIMPKSVQSSLNSYHAWLHRVRPAQTSHHGSAVFAKYLVRLGIYMAWLAAIHFSTQIISIRLARIWVVENALRTGLTSALWFFMCLLSLPILVAISKYANHIILLLITRNKRILHHLNITLFYNTLDILSMCLLGTVFLIFSFRFVQSVQIVASLGAGIFIVGYFFRKKINVVKEWLEKALDRITGLATSEPTRRAVIQKGEKTLLLLDITDQVALPKNSPLHDKTIRDLRLREETGASIVAIYRDGKHIANPGPDIKLMPDDVLVLIGNEEELIKGKRLLLSGPR
jgi:CPA2 family monovalent cation:H+ antiporter-2